MAESKRSRLTLTRKHGERVVLETAQGTIEVSVDLRGHRRVRLSFLAPYDVRIVRAELLPDLPPSRPDGIDHDGR